MQIAQQLKKPGVVDILNAGFANINRRLWIICVPVLLDFLLWRGPHITPLPLFQRLLAWGQASLGSGASLVAPNGQRVEELRQTAEAAIAGFNMLSLLVLNVVNVPTTTSTRPGDTPFVIPIHGELSFVLLVFLLQAMGLLLGCVYFGLIAQQVRDGAISPARLFAKLGSYFANVLLLVLIVLAAGAVVGTALGLLFAAGYLLGAAAAQVMLVVVATLLYLAIMWALICLFFTIDAIMVSEVRAPRAILNSVSVVKRNFWSALALISLTFFIVAGTQVIWSSLSTSSWGVVAGILGNAYVASGLTAASMLFYQSRVSGLEKSGFNKRFLWRG